MATVKKIKQKQTISKDGKMIYYTLEWGRESGQRIATGLFTYKKPANAIQQKHNKDILLELETRKNEKFKEINSSIQFDSDNKIKSNSDFIEFYEKYVDENSISTRRHLQCSFSAFKKFVDNDTSIKAEEITEELATEFRNYLLENYNGETPGEYFQCFKKVCAAATKDKYFLTDPALTVVAKMNESSKKDTLDIDEWKKVLEMPCPNNEVKKAAIFSLYSGLRWCDVESLEWNSIKNDTLKKKQNKTERTVEIPLHPIALTVLGTHKSKGKVFDLPTQDGANKALGLWVKSAGVDKHITWHSLRHSLSVFLQDEGMSAQTVAGILGHKNSVQVMKTYQRYSSKQAKIAIDKLPTYPNSEKKEAKEVSNTSSAEFRMKYVQELKSIGYTKDEIKEELAKLT